MKSYGRAVPARSASRKRRTKPSMRSGGRIGPARIGADLGLVGEGRLVAVMTVGDEDRLADHRPQGAALDGQKAPLSNAQLQTPKAQHSQRARGPIEPAQPVQPEPHQHPMHPQLGAPEVHLVDGERDVRP